MEITNTPQSDNALQKLNLAEKFFQLESSGSPDELLDRHEQWLKGELEKIGVDGRKRHLHSISYYNELPNKEDHPILSEIYNKAIATSENIATALIWKYLPNYASWKTPPTITIPSRMVLIDHDRIKSQIDENIRDWYSPMNNYKSPLAGYKPKEGEKGDIIMTVNEHFEGPRGHITTASYPWVTEGEWQYLQGGDMLSIKVFPRNLTGWLPSYNQFDDKTRPSSDSDIETVYGLKFLQQLLLKVREADISGKPNAVMKPFRAY
jgi:hypothetical protein